MPFSKAGLVCAVFAAHSLMIPAALAQSHAPEIMKLCGEKWQSAKTANTAAGQTWPQFLAKCRIEAAASAVKAAAPQADPPTLAAPAAPSAAGASEIAQTPAKPIFPAHVDAKYAAEKPAKQRRQSCLDQYNLNKAAAGGANGGLVWNKKGGAYFSQCNKHLGGGRAKGAQT